MIFLIISDINARQPLIKICGPQTPRSRRENGGRFKGHDDEAQVKEPSHVDTETIERTTKLKKLRRG